MHRNAPSYLDNFPAEPILAADYPHSEPRVAYQPAHRVGELIRRNTIEGARGPRTLAQVTLPRLVAEVELPRLEKLVADRAEAETMDLPTLAYYLILAAAGLALVVSMVTRLH